MPNKSPIAANNKTNKVTQSQGGEYLISAIFRLPQLIKLHLPNNQFIISSITDFRTSLESLSTNDGTVTIRIYHGRFYINDDHFIYHPRIASIISRVREYLLDRDIYGLRFRNQEELSDKSILTFFSILGKSINEENQIVWIKTQLEGSGEQWIEILSEADFKKSSNAQHYMESSSTMGTMARQTYSRALSSITSAISNLGKNSKPGRVQKSKRIIQTMAEIITEDESTILAMSTIRNYDDYTYTHSVNVAILAMCLGKRLELSRNSISVLGLCGLFHDLGKLEVPIEIIQKKGHLTNDEYDVVKQHVAGSVRHIVHLQTDYQLKSKLLLPPFEHHMHLDHSGYPQVSKQEPLSLFGRIISIADIYDAMISNRCYHTETISPHQALKYMVDIAIAYKLDPIILKVFINMIGVYPIGTLVILDTHEVGLVMDKSIDAENGRPLVQLIKKNPDGNICKDIIVDLSERDSELHAFTRNITRCAHPSEYGIQASDFLV